MEKVTRFYVARVNVTNGEISYINVNRFNGLPSAQANIDDAEGFVERKDARSVVQSMNLINKAVKGNYEYYDVRRDETTNPFIDQLSDEAKKWFEEPSEEEPVEEEQPAE